VATTPNSYYSYYSSSLYLLLFLLDITLLFMFPYPSGQLSRRASRARGGRGDYD
jgi:hypothetical protein